MQQEHDSLRTLIFTALWAAIIFVGISLIRVPIPALVGRPFLHFGNTLTVLAILLLGGWYGGLAGAIGLGLFDVLNGYAATAWLTVLEVIVLALVVSGCFKLMDHKDQPRWHIILLAVIAGVTKLVTSYLVGIVEAMMAGTTFKVAIVAAFVSLPATAINSLTTIIMVPILYYLLKNIRQAMEHR